MSRPVTEPFYRIMKHIVKINNGCWIWHGKQNGNGYGQTGSGGRNGRDILVHRATYEHFYGAIEDGLDLDHKCRNRLCCNPDHLEPVTRRENLIRGNHPNMVTKRTGVCQRGHLVMGDNAITGRDGRIRCRACTNMRKRSYWHKDRKGKDPAMVEDKGDFVWRGVTR